MSSKISVDPRVASSKTLGTAFIRRYCVWPSLANDVSVIISPESNASLARSSIFADPRLFTGQELIGLPTVSSFFNPKKERKFSLVSTTLNSLSRTRMSSLANFSIDDIGTLWER
ncbi:MAG: hypothetical protein BWY93_01962 [Euryarchaeota archaeon ADurb.BinA087]|nr:MAG: hypothetical protein BWY93_01962 [Euryarchaeota archaeon ADurb.BinA087]